MKERIIMTLVLWLIGKYLNGYHLSRNPVRKKKLNGTEGQDRENYADIQDRENYIIQEG